jgi:hypothetical protein
MSEFAPNPDPNEALRIHDKELAHLGALVVEAAMRSDLEEVVTTHVVETGVENPNSYAPNMLRIGQQVVPESGDSIYRQINENGVMDLAESGIVRGAKTAGAEAKTNGHTTYWNQGEAGKGSTLGQGLVIEAPVSEGAESWVTADKITGIYTKDSDGQVKNILPEHK